MRGLKTWVWTMWNQLGKSDYCNQSQFWSGARTMGGVEPRDATMAAVHYGFTSALIAVAFVKMGHKPKAVLDIGSGTGRWLDWYSDTFGASVKGVELDRGRVNELLAKGHDVTCGDALDALKQDGGKYDTINAVGVLHHVLPDSKRVDLVHSLLDHLTPGGVLVIGGYFLPWRVQYTQGGMVYKKCWSWGRWRRVLRGLRVSLYRNPCCRWRRLPQNNIVVVGKS